MEEVWTQCEGCGYTGRGLSLGALGACWEAVARREDCSSAQGGSAAWGGQGLDPRRLLSPFTTLQQAQGSPTCTRLHRGPWVLEKMSPEAAGPQGVVGQALGGQTGWLPHHQLPGSAAQEPLQMGGTQGQAPKEESWANVLRFQGAISGVEGRAAVHRAAHPSPAAPAASPTLERCVSVSCLLPEGSTSLLYSLGLVTTRPWLASSTLSLLGLCAYGWHKEPA